MIEDRWDAAAAAELDDPLDQRVQSSRLLGADPSLVLHGGGNTSVKIDETTITGSPERRLYVKGSGWDLATIERAGFTPLRLDGALELTTLERLDDLEMARQLSALKTDPDAPPPSVESLLHALIPHRFVDHTHADSIVTLTNTVHGEELVREVFGDSVLVLPYAMPGFDLARLFAARMAEEWSPSTSALILMNHGAFTFGDTAEESYRRMIDLVRTAEDAIGARVDRTDPEPGITERLARSEISRLRADISRVAGVPLLLQVDRSPAARAFAADPRLADLVAGAPATPDHVIWTKPRPLIGLDVDAYARDYRDYFQRGARRARTVVRELDAAPRAILDPAIGLATAGRTAGACRIVRDIWRHTIDIVRDSDALGGCRSLDPDDVFDVEYWDLEQAKVRRAARPGPLAGQVALVTGAASGIGRACAAALLADGAAVVGLDRDASIATVFAGDAWLGLEVDVTDADAVSRALDAAVDDFGGIDILVLNAGVFPSSTPVTEVSDERWRAVMAVNVDANVALLRLAHPLLALAPGGGRVIAIGSKNVAAPGPGAAAYSASKAALTQVARVLALEWAPDGIRVNVIHPDSVFDTGIWTPEVLAERAARYGVDVEEYRRRNLLRTEITSDDVGRLCAVMAGPVFAKTTGAQVPIDGGNDRVI